MRRVAGNATFDLHCLMFENKGTGFVRVAFETDGVFGDGRPRLANQESTMRIVAVVAFHESLVNTVMEGARELLLCFEMAAVTELRLLFLHQKPAFFGVMWRVAIRAPDVVLQVRGAAKICVLFAILMAIQAAGTHFLCRNVLEGKNLTFVSASIDVFLARPMTSLATLPLGPFLGVHGGHEVRRSLVVLVEILSGRVLVAALAHFGTNVERRVGEPLVSLGFLRRARIAPALMAWNQRSEET